MIERGKNTVVHELAHCYQRAELWQRWAHEGHARFLEVMLSSRESGEYSGGTAAEDRFVEDFDQCMNDLRVRKRAVSPYSCGSVAYWLRWLETGRVTMIAEGEVAEEAAPVAARFVGRSATESEIVGLAREKGVTVEVDHGVLESPASVRSRLFMGLLRHGCGDAPFGFWTNDATITLDTSACPGLDTLEVQTVAGFDVMAEAHAGYGAAVESCAAKGRVQVRGVAPHDAKDAWLACDRSYEWPSTVGSRYRLVAPFALGTSGRLEEE